MTPQFRFTFFNAALYPGGIVVNQPLGWRDAKLSLTRDPVFHSLIEYFKGTFIWYGTARDVIVEVETAQGVGAKLRVLIEQQYSAGWVSIFDGLIDISQLEDITNNGTFYKVSAPIIRDDFWTKIINRRGIKADLSSTIDMDGNAIAAVGSFTFNLKSQKINKAYNGSLATSVHIDNGGGDWAPGGFVQIDMDTEPISELSTKFNLPFLQATGIPVSLYNALEAGVHTFNIQVAVTIGDTVTAPSSRLGLFIAINNEAPIAFASVDIVGGDSGPSMVTIYTYSASRTLKIGDQIHMWGLVFAGASLFTDFVFLGVDNAVTATTAVPTYLNISAVTVVPDTTCEVFRIYEAFASILEKITGQVGCLPGAGQEILECSGTYHLTPGTAVRGYSLADKPLFASLDDLWQGADPLFNLGMGYFDAGGGVQNLEILKKAAFYDKTPVVNLSNVPNLVRTYSLEKIFRKITTGFKSWSAESGGGVDDPQTKHDYDTGFASVGKDISLISTFYAASLGIEQARRQRKEKSNDYRLDNEIMIFAYNHGDLGQPELDENFTSITNLLNSSTRYNSRLTPAENMLRWINYFNGCMQNGGSGKYFFRAGEGNIKMTSQLNGGDCDPSISKSENGDLDVTGDFMFLPEQYKCSMPMSKTVYDTILANRKKAIGISATASGHIPMFIMDMDYSIMFGRAEFTLLRAA